MVIKVVTLFAGSTRRFPEVKKEGDLLLIRFNQGAWHDFDPKIEYFHEQYTYVLDCRPRWRFFGPSEYFLTVRRTDGMASPCTVMLSEDVLYRISPRVT